MKTLITTALAFSTFGAVVSSPLQVQASQQSNYSEYWLLVQFSATAPSHTIEGIAENPDLTHQQKVLGSFGLTRDTMDQADLKTKLELIKQNNFAFVEAEATGTQVMPMPSHAACKKAGDIIANRFTVPSQMTVARYECIPGR